jgi:hypothetical protein
MKLFFVLFVAALFLSGTTYFLFFSEPAQEAKGVSSFADCAAAGHFIIDTFPRQCQTPEGAVFFEEEPADMRSEVRQATPE